MAETSAPLTGAEQVSQKISELQVSLQQQLPNYESQLHIIHTMLGKNEELVHLLTEEQIGTVVAGLTKKKAVVFAEEKKTSGKTASGKKLKDISVDDL